MAPATRAAAAAALLALAQGLRQEARSVKAEAPTTRAPYNPFEYNPMWTWNRMLANGRWTGGKPVYPTPAPWRKPPPQAHKRSPQPMAVLSTHHQTGQKILHDLVDTQEFARCFGRSEVLEYDVVQDPHSWPDAPPTTASPFAFGMPVQKQKQKELIDDPRAPSRVYYSFDTVALQNLRRKPRPYRMLHIIREPVSLVVEGYFHHLRKEDAPRTMKDLTGPSSLRKLNFFKGVEQEAKAEVAGTLKEIYKVMERTRNDPHVLTVDVEDFKSNFAKTARCVYSWLAGESKAYEVPKLVQAAVLKNLKGQQFEGQDKIAPTRDWTDDELKEAAASVADFDPDPIWKMVRDYREAFGYRQDPDDPKVWRFHQPYCDYFSA